MDESFAQINTSNLYYAKKSLRKILRTANKYVRYTGDKIAEVEILLHYLTNLKGMKLNWQKNVAINNLYKKQLQKIEAAIEALHEDLQYEYKIEWERLKF